MLNTFLFIQRTEQVLIELDISAIEKYVIIIIIINGQKGMDAKYGGREGIGGKREMEGEIVKGAKLKIVFLSN